MLIQDFKDEFRFLSNFYPCKVVVDDIEYPSSEHAYQAQKTTDVCKRKVIATLETPGMAKSAGRALTIREDWQDIKLSVMFGVLMAKFTQNKNLREMLLATEDTWLVEGNTWGDEFWGKDLKKHQGENWLGRLLMLVRSIMFEMEGYDL